MQRLNSKQLFRRFDHPTLSTDAAILRLMHYSCIWQRLPSENKLVLTSMGGRIPLRATRASPPIFAAAVR